MLLYFYFCGIAWFVFPAVYNYDLYISTELNMVAVTLKILIVPKHICRLVCPAGYICSAILLNLCYRCLIVLYFFKRFVSTCTYAQHCNFGEA